ncbi:MAG: class I SAM-dependent methyltransferase [Bacteriovoracaceae bacterium]|nr:class I SAM-dependent methyltransferase [Bacteriovoracaceae bacterium]
MLKKILLKRLPHKLGQTISKDDLEGVAHGIPGEWVLFVTKNSSDSGKQGLLGFLNMFQQQGIVGQLVGGSNLGFDLVDENISVEQVIVSIMKRAFDLRRQVLNYQENSRLFFGFQDGLPGLIIDSYSNAVLVQINTAGVDQFRSLIEQTIKNEISEKNPIIFLDQSAARQKEQLPEYEDVKTPVPEFIEVIESTRIQLKIHRDKLQKQGYYYDHRDNRERLYQKLTQLKLDKNNGLDLFCYHGSWGITLLQAGVEHVHFVDQGNLGTEVFQNLSFNNLHQRKGDFFEQDAFQFLDQQFAKGTTYNVIVSDPPSFTKSPTKLAQSLSGYKNLHSKVLRCAALQSLVVFCSCTSYVSIEQFEESIQIASQQTKRKLRLVDVGLQALDHPVRKLNDKSNYLKYLAYIVE